MLKRDIAASSLTFLCKNFNSVKRYGKRNVTVFALSLWEKYRWGLTSFGQFLSHKLRECVYNHIKIIKTLLVVQDFWRSVYIDTKPCNLSYYRQFHHNMNSCSIAIQASLPNQNVNCCHVFQNDCVDFCFRSKHVRRGWYSENYFRSKCVYNQAHLIFTRRVHFWSVTDDACMAAY